MQLVGQKGQLLGMVFSEPCNFFLSFLNLVEYLYDFALIGKSFDASNEE